MLSCSSRSNYCIGRSDCSPFRCSVSRESISCLVSGRQLLFAARRAHVYIMRRQDEECTLSILSEVSLIWASFTGICRGSRRCDGRALHRRFSRWPKIRHVFCLLLGRFIRPGHEQECFAIGFGRGLAGGREPAAVWDFRRFAHGHFEAPFMPL